LPRIETPSDLILESARRRILGHRDRYRRAKRIVLAKSDAARSSSTRERVVMDRLDVETA
jgi:hypothetical protein